MGSLRRLSPLNLQGYCLQLLPSCAIGQCKMAREGRLACNIVVMEFCDKGKGTVVKATVCLRSLPLAWPGWLQCF